MELLLLGRVGLLTSGTFAAPCQEPIAHPLISLHLPYCLFGGSLQRKSTLWLHIPELPSCHSLYPQSCSALSSPVCRKLVGSFCILKSLPLMSKCFVFDTFHRQVGCLSSPTVKASSCLWLLEMQFFHVFWAPHYTSVFMSSRPSFEHGDLRQLSEIWGMKGCLSGLVLSRRWSHCPIKSLHWD
jgi:hypothetical protein